MNRTSARLGNKDVSDAAGGKKRTPRVTNARERSHSAVPLDRPEKVDARLDKKISRRCASLSPENLQFMKMSSENLPLPSTSQDKMGERSYTASLAGDENLAIPQCMKSKMLRTLTVKKREFIKMRKSLITQQNVFLETFALLRELEDRCKVQLSDCLGEVRILSVSTWPAHELLMLLQDNHKLNGGLTGDLAGVIGPQIVQQLHAQLIMALEEVQGVCAELMTRRLNLLGYMRLKQPTNIDWEVKNAEFDTDTEHLQRLVAETADSLKAKVSYSLELAKIPWMDRDSLIKKLERLQKKNMILQHKLDEAVSGKHCAKEGGDKNGTGNTASVKQTASTLLQDYQATQAELNKERAEREALKNVVTSAERMLRVARNRIGTLERQIKDLKAELETSQRKQKDLENLYRNRETSYDNRSKKVSKSIEPTIDNLSRQRDALELRVKELREQLQMAEEDAKARTEEQRAQLESLAVVLADREKKIKEANKRTEELENKIKELEETINNLRERSRKLIDIERKHYLEYLPAKENEPSDQETEVWKEIQLTRVALQRAEDELRQSRIEKDNFLNSLSKISVISDTVQQKGVENFQDAMAKELLEKEKCILKLKKIIEEQHEKEKLMEQSIIQYKNQLVSLRFENKRLRQYDCYSKDETYQDLKTELLELHMQVEALMRERSALVSAAASRSLMLERHERAAHLFANVTRARRELVALLEGRAEPPPPKADISQSELLRSVSTVCTSSNETWTALRAERERVLRLEGAVLAQSLQLQREGLVRTQLERRRALLERQLLRARVSFQVPAKNVIHNKNPSPVN